MIALKTHPGCRSGLLQLYAFRLSHAYVEVVVCLRYSAMVAFICHQQSGPQNHNLSYSSCKSLLALERAMEFGVIASAIGVVGVAAQTIEVITKVRSLVQEAGDAPSNIKNIAAELYRDASAPDQSTSLLGPFASVAVLSARYQTNCRVCYLTPVRYLLKLN
ncbi:hypothetical protein D6D29_05634 [Aureobasidium pullulans]|nr:hypothetical protein D6D29_05634 [Aureobasidium pullulans]THX89247.1 hypothetical protein D6D08_03874 [Aureobasidium pullulans]